MKLKAIVTLNLLSFNVKFTVAQGASYGYNSACGLMETVTTTVYISGTCVPSDETLSTIGTAVFTSATINSSIPFDLATTTLPIPTFPTTSLGGPTTSSSQDSTIHLTNTIEITQTIDIPESSSTDSPEIFTTSEELASTSMPSSPESFSPTSDFVIPTGTSSNIGQSTSSKEQITSASYTISIYPSTTEIPPNSSPPPDNTPPSSDLSTLSFSSIDTSTTTAGGIVTSLSSSGSESPTAPLSTDTSSTAVTGSKLSPTEKPLLSTRTEEPTTSTGGEVNTLTSALLTVTIIGESTSYSTIIPASLNCTHRATSPSTIYTNEGQFTQISSSPEAPATTKESTFGLTATLSSPAYSFTYTSPFSRSNTSSSPTAPLTTDNNEGQFTETSSPCLTSISPSISMYSSGNTIAPTIAVSFTEIWTLLTDSATHTGEFSTSAPIDTSVPSSIPPYWPEYGHAHGSLASGHHGGRPTTLRKVRKGNYNSE